jgi:ATP-dependent DNA helicase RecG
MQTAVMAPTEILATQHSNTFRDYLSESRVRMELLIGGMSASQRRDARARVAAGEADIVFGTHALIEEEVAFKRLALLVVDEQHKFGVVQRAKLREKGTHPHCLVMTATPIPRTLMLSVFGDLDVSTIEHLPPGRVPIETKRVAPGQIDKVFDLIRSEVAAGRQAYIVYPLVEETGELELKAAAAMHERLRTNEFRDLSVGLLTGRMSADEKDAVMRDFRDRKIHVLVATVVVEVGLDVPNATVMVIENAERFGLSQLHQLRGRIGRSGFKSWCIAVAAPTTDEAKQRIKVFVECSDGFRLAEEDLRLRGPGEFFGTRQHGLPELKVGNIVEDYDLLKLTASDARALIAEDPSLSDPRFRKLRRQVLDRFGETLELVDVG